MLFAPAGIVKALTVSPIYAQGVHFCSGGAHGPTRVVVGALADHIFASSLFPVEQEEAVGEGADCNTRGACAPQTAAVRLFFVN